MGSGAYFKAVIDAMGTAAYNYADKSIVEVSMISKSPVCFKVWQKSVNSMVNEAFDEWQITLSPAGGRYNSMSLEQAFAVENAIKEWRARISGILTKNSYQFSDIEWKYAAEPSGNALSLKTVDNSNKSDVIGGPSASNRTTQRALPEAKLRSWWESLGNRREDKSLVLLLREAREVHAGYFVSRERVRALAPGRKRGRPVIGGKLTAD